MNDWKELIVPAASLLAAILTWILKQWVNVKIDAADRAKLQWAIEQGVAYAAEHFRSRPGATGEVKKAEAIELARSIAPQAIKKLDAEQASKLVDATYAKMRGSLPHPTGYLLSPSEAPPPERVGGLPPPPLEALPTNRPPRKSPS